MRDHLVHDNSPLTISDLGAGPKSKNAIRSVSSVTKNTAIPEKYGRLLSHTVDHFKCTSILEMGSCLGFSTAYLAMANSKAKVITLEGDESLALIAGKNFEKLHLKNIELIKGDFADSLLPALNKLNSVDLAFIDGNHRFQPTMEYFQKILPFTHNNSILIFDD